MTDRLTLVLALLTAAILAGVVVSVLRLILDRRERRQRGPRPITVRITANTSGYVEAMNRAASAAATFAEALTPWWKRPLHWPWWKRRLCWIQARLTERAHLR